MPSHDLLVIGAGPAGYVAAIRAAQLGLNVGIVEKEKLHGGTCLRVGCIPSKALLESSHKYEEVAHGLASHGVKVAGVELDLKTMLGRKDKVVTTLGTGIAGLLKKNKVTVYSGTAAIQKDKRVTVGTDSISAKNILIATGSVPSSLPGITLGAPGVDSSTEALAYGEVPKTLTVIGAGVIGLELGSVWRRLGAQVTVVEYLPRIFPGMDEELAKAAQKTLEKQGIKFRLGCKVQGVEGKPGAMKVLIDGQEAQVSERVLVAVGRKPNTEGLGLENIGIIPNKRGQIEVNGHFQTNVPGVYAIGDVVPGPMLAHKAEEEGVACVEFIATGYGHVDYNAIPGVVYTHPEIASVGKTEEQLKEAGIAYTSGKFLFAANGRARAIDQAEGFVKVLADKTTDRILGVHIIGPIAGDLIAECATAMAFHASSEDLARACHAHPSLSEAVKEAALAAQGRVIHM